MCQFDPRFDFTAMLALTTLYSMESLARGRALLDECCSHLASLEFYEEPRN